MSVRSATTAPAYFEAIYAEDDPFGYRSRWYEARKRALLLAALPQSRVDDAWEIGCSNGELTAALAPRCARLLATDLDARAVVLARARTAALDNVRVEHMRHPAQWPQGRFDLVVFSEVGYYFDAGDLETVARRLRATLADEGVLVACHWRHAFDAAPLCGDAVHAALARHFDHGVFAYADDDLLLDAWSMSGTSVAQREGLR